MAAAPAIHRPGDVAALCALIADAAARAHKLAITGGASKASIGAPSEASSVDMCAFRGVVDYDPPELVLTVKPGTPLAEVQALVASQGQMLAFDPFDHGRLLGNAAGYATIGGVIAAGVSGPARLSHGGARDHLLGARAVSGRGELFVAGAKVVKNVTGYDVPKLLAGSWGRLAALTELTLKVLPAPEKRVTLIVAGLHAAAAANVLAEAMRAPLDVAAAAHLPSFAAGSHRPATAFRLQGFPASVAARRASLHTLLAAHGPIEVIEDEACGRFWEAIAHVEDLADAPVLWRVSTAPSGGLAVVNAFAGTGARWQWDWAGGLTWLGYDGDPAFVRKVAADAMGHAMLVRAPAEMRMTVPAFDVPSPGLASLEGRVRRAFDPAGVFETRRF